MTSAMRAGALAAALLIVSDAGVARAGDLPVALNVQSKSWIVGSAFDEAAFRSVCRDAGIELVPATAPGTQAAAVVIYTETKGPGFSMFGVGQPVGFGTNIAFKLTLLSPVGAKTLATVTAQSETPRGIPKEEFHDASRRALIESPPFKLSCAAVAAALGSRAQALRLLPWSLFDSQALDLLERIKFTPQSDQEKAYIAVAKRDFTAAQALAAAAREPLLLLFENSATDRNGVGTLPAGDPAHARTLTRALSLLSFAGDDRTPDVLSTFLNDYADYRSEDDPVMGPLLALVLQTLGKVGNVFTIPLLEEWQAGDGPLAKAAAAAAQTLRRRISIE